MFDRLRLSVLTLVGRTLPADASVVQADEGNTLKEWTEARSTIARFDDTLMKIRTVGLPGISTLTGLGSVFGSDGPRIDAEWWAIAIITGAFGITFIFVGLLLYGFAQWNQKCKRQREPVPFGLLECVLFVFVGTSTLLWIPAFWSRQPASYPFPAPVLVAGALVLLSIYLLDRFYYTVLLKASVDRAREIEGSLGFRLSGEITTDAHEWTYTVLPTIFYLTPTFVLLNIGLAVAAFAHVKPAATPPFFV